MWKKRFTFSFSLSLSIYAFSIPSAPDDTFTRCISLSFFFSLSLSLFAALAARRALLGSRAVLECDLNSVSNVAPSSSSSSSSSSSLSSSSSSSSRSPGALDTTHSRSTSYNQSSNNNGNINNPDSLIQVIVWYKGNITGAPIYSIDARSSGGSLESAVKFPAKSYGNRLTLNPTVRPIALVIDPVELEDDGDYFCRMVSALASFTRAVIVRLTNCNFYFTSLSSLFSFLSIASSSPQPLSPCFLLLRPLTHFRGSIFRSNVASISHLFFDFNLNSPSTDQSHWATITKWLVWDKRRNCGKFNVDD